jgi:hypothetical protein
MAGDGANKKVTLEFIAEVRQALENVRSLKQEILSLGSAQTSPHRGQFGDNPPPEPPVDFGPGSRQRYGGSPGSSIPQNGLNYTNQAPGAGSPTDPHNATTVTLTGVSVVNITAASVNLIGGGFGGGTGGGGITGAAQAA